MVDMMIALSQRDVESQRVPPEERDAEERESPFL